MNAVKVGNQDLSSRLSVERDDLAKLLEVATEITPDAFLQFLIKQQILVVSGVAGVGKSQLFAVAAERLLSENRAAILLLGSDYISNQSFFTQTPGVLLTDLSFDALLYKLEALAIQRNAPSCIFIDAVNESVDKNIWKSELPKLFSLLKKYPHVKLAISVRSGYEKLVFSDSITQQIETSQVGSIVHHGFTGETIKATFIFLNYYGIPFLPTYFLQSEMTNPLFLTLFCKTYTGENYDMYALFDKLIEKSDTEALEKVLQDCDLCFNYDILKAADIWFDRTGDEIIDKEQAKFPMTFTPDTISATHGMSRKVSISQFQFLAAKEQTQANFIVTNPYSQEGIYRTFRTLELTDIQNHIMILVPFTGVWNY